MCPLLRREHRYQECLRRTTQGLLRVLRKSTMSLRVPLLHIAHSQRCRSARHLTLCAATSPVSCDEACSSLLHEHAGGMPLGPSLTLGTAALQRGEGLSCMQAACASRDAELRRLQTELQAATEAAAQREEAARQQVSGMRAEAEERKVQLAVIMETLEALQYGSPGELGKN